MIKGLLSPGTTLDLLRISEVRRLFNWGNIMHSDVRQLKIFKSGFQSEKYYAGVGEILCRGRAGRKIETCMKSPFSLFVKSCQDSSSDLQNVTFYSDNKIARPKDTLVWKYYDSLTFTFTIYNLHIPDILLQFIFTPFPLIAVNVLQNKSIYSAFHQCQVRSRL